MTKRIGNKHSAAKQTEAERDQAAFELQAFLRELGYE
jgi:hypothetical protein